MYLSNTPQTNLLKPHLCHLFFPGATLPLTPLQPSEEMIPLVEAQDHKP